ncbi:MAG: family 10 glycosylhydrolase [Candidatus Euphemobacter frigidus]|nr:family 10 glycosylhydrolase [Candidatus Euphemobacter frigidus]MDP8276527.1 family 10 glycosylhydrolase [Candidatus Euphemobacter frigidus]
MRIGVKKSLIILLLANGLSASPGCRAAAPLREARGLWVECEGSQETLSTRAGIDQLIQRASEAGFNTLFVQVYRHDRAWFNSRYADATPYRDIVKREQIDPLAYLIGRAHRAGLRVHAWLNMFRIGKDRKAPILKRFGGDIITRDGRGKSLLSYKPQDLPDGGYWLDPGDEQVSLYLRNIIAEVVRKYPGLDGIHLDFTRYPYNTPHAGSRWANRNDLGYGKESVRRFKKWTGLDPMTMELTRSNCQAWDNWRRLQVNNFVESAGALVRSLEPSLTFSVAVIAWADRAYLSSFQDWRRWLEEGTVDFVAPMNYGTDSRLARYLTWTALAARGSRQVYIGLGEYLLGNKPEVLLQQMADCRKAGADGIVLFSYDSMCKKPHIFNALKKNVFQRQAAVPEMPWKKNSNQ